MLHHKEVLVNGQLQFRRVPPDHGHAQQSVHAALRNMYKTHLR
jgi:hypothetical protein